MDMLGSNESSLAILDYYRNTNEDIKVNGAIEKATDKTELLNETRHV